jgi:YVTN family beta-propeller protein
MLLMALIDRSNLARLALAGASLLLATGMAAAAPKAYVGNFADSTVSAIDTGTGKVVATIPVATGPHGMQLTEDGRTLFVTGDGSSSMSVIDTATDKVTKTVDVGQTPNGISLTPDGTQLLVAANGTDKILFLDAKTLATLGSVDVKKPHTVSLTPDGKLAYVTSQDPGHFAIVAIDVAKRAVTATVPLDKTPRDAEFGFDGKEFYYSVAGLSAIEVLDPKVNKVVAEVPTGVSPHFVTIFKQSPQLGMIIVQGPGELALFDPATNKVVRSIKIGQQPHWLALSGDGKTAYATNEGSNTLSIIDVASGKTSTVDVGKMPRKVVVQQTAQAAAAPSGDKVKIENFAFGPQKATVKVGDSITWNNDDALAHTVTFKNKSPGAKNLNPGEGFTRKFDKAETLDYFCSYHPYMTGQVVVQ